MVLKTIIAISLVVILSAVFLTAIYYQMPNINLKDYPVIVDMGTMTQEEQNVFLDILDNVENRQERVLYSENIDIYSILTHLGLYYGSEESVHKLVSLTSSQFILKLDVFDTHMYNKIVVESRIDEMLMNLKEGSDKFKLFQIALYLSERIEYTHDFRESIDGLNGQGVCSTYAMLFYKAASRLGVKTYICYGYAGDGYHAWNMVELDGKQYFYDITWFDSGGCDFRYLHSESCWGRIYSLNNKWAYLYVLQNSNGTQIKHRNNNLP